MSSKVCKRTLCVKNLPQPSDNLVSSLFGPLGGVLLKVITTGDNNRKDILVEFESEELASKAREAMHGKVVDGTNLFVDYAILGQPSFTSPSKDKALKQKVSVLDRIIKPGNVKSSKAEDKNAVAGGQANGKEGSGPDNQDNANTCQQKPANEAKTEKGQVVSQANIVKRGKAGDSSQQNSGTYESKNNRGDRVQNKKSYIMHQGKRGPHKMQRKLEIIKPKQEPPRAPEDKGLIMPKEVSTIMKDNPELTGNPQLVKTVFELVQKKLENTTKEIASRTTSKSRHYDSSVKNKNYSRSRSRSRGPSYSRHNRSGSRGKPDFYFYSNPRRSKSPSSNQKHLWRPRSRSRSKSYDRNTSSRRDYSYSRDPYYDSRYRDSDPYFRRSRSRSGSRRGDYSPYRDRQLRRDDDRYYKDRNSRDRSRSRSRMRSRSRSRSWTRSRSRPNYRDYRNRSSRSRSRSRSGYRDPAYRKEEARGTYKSRYVTKGGLVIEKKNVVPRKYESTYAREADARYDRREYSRSRSRDGRYLRSSRSASRDRGSMQSGQKGGVDYYRYRDRSYGKHTEGDRNKKVLDIRKDNTMEQEFRNRKHNSNSKQTERNKDANYNQREKTELAGVVKGSDLKDLGPVTTDSTNQIYSNYMNLSNLQLFPNSLNFSNASGGPHIPAQNNASSLPTYLYSSSAMDPNGLAPIKPGNLLPGTNLPSETMAIHNGYNVNRNELEGERGANKTKEEMEVLNLENSTTENSNIDVGRMEEKGDLLEQTPIYDEKGENNSAITNDFIKKNKMQAFINYIIATGDIQGLKEKLKSIEKPKEK